MTDTELWEKSWDDAAAAKPKAPSDYVTDVQAAINALADISAYRECEQEDLNTGSLALHVLKRFCDDADFVDAAENMKILATAGQIYICKDGRERAGYLARHLAEMLLKGKLNDVISHQK